MSDITLYEIPGCPYCGKVRATLDRLELEYDVIQVPRSRPERTEVQAISGQSGVPVLVDEQHDVEGMHESDDIIAFLEKTYGTAK